MNYLVTWLMVDKFMVENLVDWFIVDKKNRN